MSASAPDPGAVLTSSEIPGQVDLLISLHLHLWHALTITIQNGWGTSDPQVGEDKRDWLAGAVSDLFAQNQLRDLEDLEDVLEQVMNDEFEVVVDDGSLEEVARKIWCGVEKVKKGDGSEVQSLMNMWKEKQEKGNKTIDIVRGNISDHGDDDSSDEDDDDAEDREEIAADVDMNDAPTLPRQKADPEIDEDGFTKVVSKKKR